MTSAGISFPASPPPAGWRPGEAFTTFAALDWPAATVLSIAIVAICLVVVALIGRLR